jgi:hypothetical protein
MYNIHVKILLIFEAALQIILHNIKLFSRVLIDHTLSQLHSNNLRDVIMMLPMRLINTFIIIISGQNYIF